MTKVNKLKEENIQTIRRCFYENKVLTKNEISEMTGLSLSGTTNVLQMLKEKGEIAHIGFALSTGGRKSKQYVLNSEYGYIAKVTLLKKKDCYIFQALTVNAANILQSQESIISDTGSQQDFIALMEQVLQEKKIKVVVISIPGVCVEGMTGVCDFPDFQKIDFGRLIRKHWDIPYVIENDTNVAVIGLSQRFPMMKNIAFLYQPAEDYFGCGILIHGKLYNGKAHMAGELRFLPDLTEEEQTKLRDKDPKKLLENRVKVLCAVLDPEIIAFGSDLFSQKDIRMPMWSRAIPVHVDDIAAEIENGLFAIGKKEMLERRL